MFALQEMQEKQLEHIANTGNTTFIRTMCNYNNY